MPEEPQEELPLAVRCAYENLVPNGAFLFGNVSSRLYMYCGTYVELYRFFIISDNNVIVMLWIGNQISGQWVHDVFGVQNFAQINADKVV